MNKALVDKIVIKYAVCFYVTGLIKRDSLKIVPETLIATNVGTIASLIAACVFGCLFV